MCAHSSLRIKKQKGKDMNIEQKTNMQELAEAEYTKVYAGTNASTLEIDFYVILPIGPIKPKKPDVNS